MGAGLWTISCTESKSLALLGSTLNDAGTGVVAIVNIRSVFLAFCFIGSVCSLKSRVQRGERWKTKTCGSIICIFCL